MAIGFDFPLDNAGCWDGFNDPGIEHFTGNRLQHLGREVPQNTIDAKISNPVRIEIKLLKLPVTKIPNVAQLRTAVALCAKSAQDEDGDKAKKFFARATEILG